MLIPSLLLIFCRGPSISLVIPQLNYVEEYLPIDLSLSQFGYIYGAVETAVNWIMDKAD